LPFALANSLNSCKGKADQALREFKEKFELIQERRTEETKDQALADAGELATTPVEMEFPKIKESAFSSLEISGEKEVPQQDGSLKKFNYRDAYFNLVGLVVN